MLKRTKDSFAAHGVLAIFLLLLSASQGIPVGEVDENLTTTTTEQTTETTAATEVSNSTTYRVRDLPFESPLENPCPAGPANSSPASRQNITVEERRLYYDYIRRTASEFRQVAEEMLNQSVLLDCPSVSHLPGTPTLTRLLAMNASEAVHAMYGAVLRHTAHAYFVYEQQHKFRTQQCSSPIERQKWKELYVKQKFLACHLLQLSTTDVSNVTQSVLDESLSDLPNCSRRRIRDCQLLKSTSHILQTVSTYSETQVEGAGR